jgi:hypothetical protein
MTVGTDYEHITKLIQHGLSLELGETTLKWYDIAPAEQPVPDEIRELARETTQILELDGDLGFAILHRCGESFYFLLVSTWRNDNELWETVWAKNGDGDPTFRPWPLAEGHHPTFCVWELGAVWHEQQAWSEYLRSARDDAARQAYLRDAYEGTV